MADRDWFLFDRNDDPLLTIVPLLDRNERVEFLEKSVVLFKLLEPILNPIANELRQRGSIANDVRANSVQALSDAVQHRAVAIALFFNRGSSYIDPTYH